MTDPNRQQQRFINNTEGVYLVDAGAGTGKTFSITRRYIEILDDAEPDDIFLATFTRNAAEEMSTRIAAESDYSPSEIYNAPISTFHAYCRQLLKRHGFDAPKLLGIDGNIPREIDVVESQVRERQEFSRFLEKFRSEHQDLYGDLLVISDEDDLLDLLKSLASKGVIPQEKGWFGNTERYLIGDKARFEDKFEEANQPVEKNGGKRQSELRRRLYSMKWKNFRPEAPEMDEIRGDYGTKKVREDFKDRVFEENRDHLKAFVHDLYFEYLEYCIDRNYLNFAFVMILAFVLLYDLEQVREEESFDYLMIDEFQDTNEIQFKLTLLLADKPNIAVVGDWKQSIYSFQHASVENILEFEDRLVEYIYNLDDHRVSFDVEDVETIELEKNYRSSQKVLDSAETSLGLPAHRKDSVSQPEMVHLESQIENSGTVEKFCHEDEAEAVLSRIVEIVDSSEYTDKDGEKLGFSDIAVLARTRSFGLKLQRKAREHGVPVTYEGGVELFATPPGKILLAWLRIVNSDSRRGWATVLEQADYRLEESRKILDEQEYPDKMIEFREELSETESIPAVAVKVFNRYGYSSEFTEKIVEVIDSTFSGSLMNLGEIVEFMEQNIEEKEIYQVDASTGAESVKIQTVHAAKGLEYPCVFVSGVNRSVFPSTISDSKAIRMMGSAGLRQTKVYSDEHGFTFDSWQAEVISKVMSGEYNEERRLLYVAMTRAEKHLFVTAERERESTFYSALEVEEFEPEIDLENFEVEARQDSELLIDGLEEEERLLDLREELGIDSGYSDVVRWYLLKDSDAYSELEEEIIEKIDSLEGRKVAGWSFIYGESGRVFEGSVDLLVEEGSEAVAINFVQGSPSENDERFMKAAREALRSEYSSVKCLIVGLDSA